MSVSTVPPVLTAIYNLAETTLDGWQVVDGPPLNNLKQKYAVIGYNNDGPGVELTQTATDYGTVQPLETYTVFSQLVSWSGSSNYTLLRGQVYEALDLLATAFQADPQLGGACLLAELSETALIGGRGNNRTAATLTWAITVQASRI